MVPKKYEKIIKIIFDIHTINLSTFKSYTGVMRVAVDNYRLQIVILHFKQWRVAICNTYFPCDTQKQFFTQEENDNLMSLTTDPWRFKYRLEPYFSSYFLVNNFENN